MSIKVNINPGPKILSILQHIEYDPWFALAEYVDNSIDSYLKNKAQLFDVEGDHYKLKVTIELNRGDNSIRITDNAAGISTSDLQRAFKAAEAPSDQSGLSEFGMGMKSASIWFSDIWDVRTSSLGESIETHVRFDLDKVYNGNIEELDVKEQVAEETSHYTVITLKNVRNMPVKRTVSKIEDHLASIYREFIRSGELELTFRNKTLIYESPEILVAPFYKDVDGPKITWLKKIEFDLSKDLAIEGFVAIREKGSTKKAGLALFRRGRVIQGSHDDTFRPETIFGRANSYKYQRIFGELHLKGFSVSFTKRGIKWDEKMGMFLDMLKHDLSHDDMPILKQAEGYRARPTQKQFDKIANDLLDKEIKTYQDNLPATVSEIIEAGPMPEENISLADLQNSTTRYFVIDHKDIRWHVCIELSYEEIISDWIEIGDHLIEESELKRKGKLVGIRLSLNHPFTLKYGGTSLERLEPLLRIAAAIGIGEEIARTLKVDKPSTVRRNLNTLLKNALID